MLFGNELSGETVAREDLWKQGNLAQTFHGSRDLFKHTPSLLPFYFTNRDRDTELGAAIRKRESAFRKKLRKFFPELDEAGLEVAFPRCSSASRSRTECRTKPWIGRSRWIVRALGRTS